MSAVGCTKCTTALWEKYNAGMVPVIPDIKCKSPGEGDLLGGRDPVEFARGLALAGAPVISVVTEKEHFGGSPKLLERVAQAASRPVLRKDFISNREQLVETAGLGASGVLLIASMLEEGELARLVEEALKLGLEPLVETHNEQEIKAVNKLNLSFVGINNRNIIEWETDGGTVNTTEKLVGLISPGALIVSESSIAGPEDVARAAAAGVQAVLVGTAILRAQDSLDMYRRLSASGRQP